MFHDDIRALTAKKYEILGELELAKAAIMREMSSVDKCSLTRLREIISHYDRLEKSVIDKLNTLDVKVAAFISNAEKDYSVFADEIEALDALKADVQHMKENPNNTRTSSFNYEQILCKSGNDFFPLYDDYYVQSIEWVERLRCFIVGFSSRNESDGLEGVIAKYDENFNFITYETVNCGHCNDIAYNPNNNRLYVATMGHGEYGNYIVAVDPDTLKIVGVHGFDGMYCWGLSFNEKTNELYALIDSKLCVFNASFDVVHCVNIEDFNGKGYNYTKQGSFILDGDFYLICEEDFNVALVRYHRDGTIIDYHHENFGTQETECGCVKDGKVYLISGQRSVEVFVGDTATLSSNSFVNFSNSGKLIKSGDDMNDFRFLAGKYRCNGGAVAATLLNMPEGYSQGGFSLFVFRTAFDRYANVIVSNLGDIYIRMCCPVEEGTRWRKIKPLRNVGEQIKIRGTFGGHMTNNGREVWFSAPHDGYVQGSVPSVVSGAITIRQNGNYLCNDLNIVGDTVEKIILDNDPASYMFRVTFKTAPTNATNNAECSVYVNCMVKA